MKAAVSIFAFTLWGFTLAAQAQFQVNQHASNNQADPAIAIDAQGNFVVAWSSYLQDGSSNGVFIRRFDSNGTALTNDIQVNTTTIGNQTEPAIALNKTGQFVVAWQGPGTSEEDIFARRFNAAAQPLGNEFAVNSLTQDRQLHPKVAIDNSRAFFIAWESKEFIASFNIWNIRCQVYDSNGLAINGELKSNLLFDSRYPDIAADGNGNFTVAWTQEDFTSPTDYIMARQYDSNGSPKDVPFEVSTEDFNAISHPSIGMALNGNFVVTWESVPSPASQKNIHARRYNYDGTPLTGQFIVNTTTAGKQQYPKAAMNNIRDFIIVWDSETIPGITERDILAQRYDSLMRTVGDEFQINTYDVNDQQRPDVCLREDGKFVAVWRSYTQDGLGDGIFGTIGPQVGSANINNDAIVNFADYTVLAKEWRKQANPLHADFVDDNKIDEYDLAVLSEQWLQGSYQCSEVDIKNDGRIDFRDYSLLLADWQRQGPNLAGDITGNGMVDAEDLNAILLLWLRTCSSCDFDNSGLINLKDFTFLAENWLKTGPDLAGDIDNNKTVNLNDLRCVIIHWLKKCQ